MSRDYAETRNDFSVPSRRTRGQHLNCAQPSLCEARPISNRKPCFSQTISVATLGEQMHLNGNSKRLERDVIGECTLHVSRVVVLCLQQECGWGLFRDLQLSIGT